MAECQATEEEAVQVSRRGGRRRGRGKGGRKTKPTPSASGQETARHEAAAQEVVEEEAGYNQGPAPSKQASCGTAAKESPVAFSFGVRTEDIKSTKDAIKEIADPREEAQSKLQPPENGHAGLFPSSVSEARSIVKELSGQALAKKPFAELVCLAQLLLPFEEYDRLGVESVTSMPDDASNRQRRKIHEHAMVRELARAISMTHDTRIRSEQDANLNGLDQQQHSSSEETKIADIAETTANKSDPQKNDQVKRAIELSAAAECDASCLLALRAVLLERVQDLRDNEEEDLYQIDLGYHGRLETEIARHETELQALMHERESAILKCSKQREQQISDLLDQATSIAHRVPAQICQMCKDSFFVVHSASPNLCLLCELFSPRGGATFSSI